MRDRRAKMAKAAGMVGVLLATMLAGACEDVSSGTVSGTIRLAPGAEAGLGASDTLFVTARQAGEKPGGPPLAVLKIVGMRFPMTYTIGQEDCVRPGTWFRGKVEIKALIRKSGIATVPMPGDVAGVHAQNPVEVGAQNVDITLAKADQ